MAFSTQRGRPRLARVTHDIGTPELRLKHALGLTTEPIDILLEKRLITPNQHWCGLHLRWLHTLRYGAPSLTTHYADNSGVSNNNKSDDPIWRMTREKEYLIAIRALKKDAYYEPVMRLATYNESPAFLNQRLQLKAANNFALREELSRKHTTLCDGLDVLVGLWRTRNSHSTP